MDSYLIWIAAGALVLIVFVPYFISFRKERKAAELRKKEAAHLGLDQARAQFPFIDSGMCIGCGSCVSACPEGDVLGVVFGTAAVINGERCVGHGYCETACPVGAIHVGLGDLSSRPDVPLLTENQETTVRGLYISGELSGLSLIRNAIAQGATAVDHIARSGKQQLSDVFDVVIVGAGPAGMSAALTARKHNLSYLVLEELGIGGTILHYPRAKLVMTQPVEIPLYGWLKQEEYSKEVLMTTWQEIAARFSLKIHTGERVEQVQKQGDVFTVLTSLDAYRARNVVLAMGRRGTPRRLDVPGEDLPKVLYSLIDAQSYRNSHVLVVGGGDSAVEAAVGLARQPGNTVTISYRKTSFFRVKKKNEDRINQLIAQRKVRPIFESQVRDISPGSVLLATPQGEYPVPNDAIFVFIGGIPPFDMLKAMGIEFGGKPKTMRDELKPRNAALAR